MLKFYSPLFGNWPPCHVPFALGRSTLTHHRLALMMGGNL